MIMILGMRENHSVERRTFLQLLGVAGALGATGLAGAVPGRAPGPKTDELLVGVSKTATPRSAVSAHLPGNARVVHENKTLGYAAVKLPDQASTAHTALQRAVANRTPIKYVEPNRTHRAFYTPNDPQYGDQYADQMVNAPTAWDTTLGDSGVTIGVVDQGVEYTHPDLQGNMASDPGRDFVDGDSDPAPDTTSENHGTHVAGIAAAGVDNGTGVTGIGNSTIISARGLDENGSGSTSDIADGIEWVTDQGADVINLSLGGGGSSQTMDNALTYAVNNGVLVVAAAGNSGGRGVSYPAANDKAMAVSALDADGSLAYYSSYGAEVEIAAPGTDVLSTVPGGYETLSGTSMATPVVAGTAGLTLAQWNIANNELRTHLKNTAVDVGLPADQQGSGRVDAGSAVTTEPGDGGGGDPPGDGDSTTGSVDSSLSSWWDSECWTWTWEYSSPSQVVVELSGPSNADFDLFLNEGTGSCPTTSSYTHRSWSSDSSESITIDAPDDSADLHILVDSYNGSGQYTLTLTEYA